MSVVEGFHVNIVLEARLNERKVWYMGLDCTLRMGTINSSIVLATLKRKHNLTFVEYKPVSPYTSEPVFNVMHGKRGP